MVCGPLDASLLRLSKRLRITYYRYADDITFSTNNLSAIKNLIQLQEVQRQAFGASHLSTDLIKIFSENGFLINPKKVCYSNYASRQMVTGLVINNKVNIRRDFYQSARSALHVIERYGYEAAQNHYVQNIRKSGYSSAHLNNFLKGRIEFIGHVTNWGPRYRRLAERAAAVLPNVKFRSRKSDLELSTFVVEDDTLISQGTCFHIGKGILVTAAHVVSNGIVTIYSNDKIFEDNSARFVWKNEEIDVAIIRSNLLVTMDSSYLKLSARIPNTGEALTAAGFPNFSPGNSITAIPCVVIGHSFRFGSLKYELDQRLEHGASGGPLISSSSSVLGIVHGGPGQDDAAPVANTMTPCSLFMSIADGFLS
jgi:hypothetical protein